MIHNISSMHITQIHLMCISAITVANIISLTVMQTPSGTLRASTVFVARVSGESLVIKMLYFCSDKLQGLFFIHYFYGSTQQDSSFTLEHPWNTVGPKECTDYGD